MGDRYHVPVRCECGFEDTAWYAPTSGFLDWKCSRCGTVIDLEAYTGIEAESTARTPDGIAGIRAAREAGRRAALRDE